MLTERSGRLACRTEVLPSDGSDSSGASVGQFGLLDTARGRRSPPSFLDLGQPNRPKFSKRIQVRPKNGLHPSKSGVSSIAMSLARKSKLSAEDPDSFSETLVLSGRFRSVHDVSGRSVLFLSVRATRHGGGPGRRRRSEENCSSDDHDVRTSATAPGGLLEPARTLAWTDLDLPGPVKLTLRTSTETQVRTSGSLEVRSRVQPCPLLARSPESCPTMSSPSKSGVVSSKKVIRRNYPLKIPIL